MNQPPAVVVREAPRPGVAERHVEMCEHKGPGHPDTMTDGACEAVARELAATYLREFGQILHFNVDKGLLMAGSSRPRFGGGTLLKPPRLIVCGRAANPGGKLDIDAIATGAARRHMRATLRADTDPFPVEPAIGESSAVLQGIYCGSHPVALANDTSFGTGYAPLSELERKVLELAAMLRSPGFRTDFPSAGDDFKIMGLRIGDRFTFTVAIAVIDRRVESVDHYFEMKAGMHARISGMLGASAALHINALDGDAAKDEGDIYLTVTGLSAEMGDDGQVGRGNRVNGLITPARSMSLEAAAGKNPVSHVGKIYNVLAHRIAAAVCAEVPEVGETSVQLLSMIGRPIDRPQVVLVEIRTRRGGASRLKARIAEVVGRSLGHITEITDELVRGVVSVC